MKITVKKTSLYYLVLVIMTIMIPLTTYPLIYGVDAFQYSWMANALRNGALFSENTWLIHPTSYFGYYPFSHVPIGVPIFLGFLLSFLEFLSFGIFGITEAILVFNIILIIIVYKSSRNLGNRLFEEEWSRFVFVAAILLSPNLIQNFAMTVSTRIIITIVMLVLLNLNLKILSNDKNNIFKSIFSMVLIILVGILAHRLWLATIIPIILMSFTIFIRKYKKLLRLTVFFIIPLSINAFFLGFGFFGLNRYGYNPDANYFEIIIFLILYYGFEVGIIILFFSVGVIITLYKVSYPIRNSNQKNAKLNKLSDKFINNNYYLLLFILPLLFIIFTTFYAIVIFLPIIIIFSVQGLIYVKEFILKLSKKLGLIFPILLLFLLFGYYILRFDIYSKILLWDVFLLLLVSLILFLSVFTVTIYNNLNLLGGSFNLHKLKNDVWLIVLTISILAYSVINVEASRFDNINNPYPWENRYLTDEEIEIIKYFENEDIEGLIYVSDPFISERIGGIGFLPTFCKGTKIGLPLFYGIISPNYVYENTEFLLDEYYKFKFYNFTKIEPLQLIRISISVLDVEELDDFDTLLSYNIQYIITINETFQSGGDNNWPLIQSLKHSESFEPVFITHHFLIWKIY